MCPDTSEYLLTPQSRSGVQTCLNVSTDTRGVKTCLDIPSRVVSEVPRHIWKCVQVSRHF